MIALLLAAALVTAKGTLGVMEHDTNGVTRVSFYVDDTLLSVDSAAPFTAQISSKPLTNGVHKLSNIIIRPGQPATTNTALIFVDNLPPSPVANLKATQMPATNQVRLTWTSATDAGGSGLSAYHVLRASAPSNLAFLAWVNGTATEFIDRGLAMPPNYNYCYAIMSIDYAGAVTHSSVVCVNPAAITPVSINFPAGGGTGTVQVIAPSNYQWTAEVNSQ